MWWIVWLGLAFALIVVEVCTMDLVSVWFAVTSLLLCIITAIFPELSFVWQICIMAGLSALLLWLTRPFVKKFLTKRADQATNLDLIRKRTAIVEEEIDNDLGKGRAKINGVSWTARSASDEKIPAGEMVVVERIEGNKLIVIKKD